MSKRTPVAAVLFALALLAALPVTATAAEKSYQLTLSAGEFDREQTPVKVTLEVPEELKDATVAELTTAGGQKIVGQLTAPGVLNVADGKNARELHFILPKLAAGETLEVTATIRDAEAETGFTWHDTAGKHAELRYGDRPVMRYMYEAVDNSTEARRGETYKVYHHVYTPSGSRLLTKGPGGLFPHHRGLFYGFNRISYERDGKKMSADVWHNKQGEDQSHLKFLAQEEGPVLGRHTALVAWNGRDGETFAKEKRQMTAYAVPGGTLIEFSDELQSEVGKIKLAGDPQHAGFQFRATQDVPDKTAKQTYYVRPDGKGEPGKFRNYPGNKEHVNLAFNAMSIVVDDQRYTIAYLDQPTNPKEARFSERDYGRFGSYFETEVTEEQPLRVNYRIWVQEGEMTPEQVARLSNDFVHPVKVQVGE